VFNRGVDKRDIFLDDLDRLTFIHDLYEFNDENPVANAVKFVEVEPPQIGDERRDERILRRYRKSPRKPLIEILAFVLMTNHFHLMIRQLVDGGIVRFMQKLGTGYTMSFNKKYERNGSLLQGRFKSVLVNFNRQLSYLPHYIHINPIDLMVFEDSADISTEEKFNFLRSYRWSSFPDYIGEENFPSLTERGFVLENAGGREAYVKDTKEFLMNRKEKLESVIDEEHIFT